MNTSLLFVRHVNLMVAYIGSLPDDIGIFDWKRRAGVIAILTAVALLMAYCCFRMAMTSFSSL